MVGREVDSFLHGWRGFLVGTRRGWHAHHRAGVVGVRSTQLLGSPAAAAGALARAVHLVGGVFRRGGTAWGFGFTPRDQTFPWGVLRGGWRPGVLSNYFFVRLPRVHFVRRLGRVFARPARRRRRGRARLSRRWGRLRRGGLPGGVFPRRRRRSRGLSAGYSVGVTALAAGGVTPGAGVAYTPLEGSRRGRWLRRWWTAAGVLPGRVRSPGFPRWSPPGGSGVVHPALVREFAGGVTRAVRGVRRRPGGSPRRARPAPRAGRTRPARGATLVRSFRRGGPARTPVGGKRFRRRPPPRVAPRVRSGGAPFPGVTLAGGLSLMGSTLLTEVTVVGAPFVHFAGVDAPPGGWDVPWNQSPASLGGVKFLLGDLAGRAARVGLFRVVWIRLGTPG